MSVQSYSHTHDAGADVECHAGVAHTAATAAGAGDATEVLGPVIDRMAPGIGGFYHALAITKAKAAIATSESLSVASKLRTGDDPDGTTGWTDYVPPPLDGQGAINETTGVYTEVLSDAEVGIDGVAEEDVYKHGFDLSGAARYIRHSVTPDLSRAGTDTATVASLIVLSGRRANP